MTAVQELAPTRVRRPWGVQDWRLRTKLLAAFLLVTLIPLAISGYIAVTASRDSLLQQGNTNLLAMSKNTAQSIDEYLAERREDIVTLSQMPDIISYVTGTDKAAAAPLAQKAVSALASRTDYDSVSIMNNSGVITLSSFDQDVGVVSTALYFQDSMLGHPAISEPIISSVSHRPSIYFSAPVVDAKGTVVGVVRSRVNLYGVWRYVERDAGEAGPGTVGMLLDNYGIRMAHSSSADNREAIANTLLYRAVAPVPSDASRQLIIDGRLAADASGQPLVLPLPEVAAAIANPGAVTTFETAADNSAVRHRAAITPLLNKPWYYVLMAPVPTFTYAADQLATYFVIILVLVALLAALAAILIASAITRPIIYLTKLAERMSLGELDMQISVTTKDEIGELADAIGRMQASLQAAIERLRVRRPS